MFGQIFCVIKYFDNYFLLPTHPITHYHVCFRPQRKTLTYTCTLVTAEIKLRIDNFGNIIFFVMVTMFRILVTLIKTIMIKETYERNCKGWIKSSVTILPSTTDERLPRRRRRAGKISSTSGINDMGVSYRLQIT